MSSHTPGQRVRAKRVRKDGGVREETGEEEADYVNERADQGSGSQGATGGQGTHEHSDTVSLSSQIITTAACHVLFKLEVTYGYYGHEEDC